MTIELYQNNSEPNVLSKDISLIGTLTGTLREGSSVIDPSFTIEIESTNIVWINYIHVTEWGRYYFVNNISTLGHNLWELECHVDVLSTYKTQILPLSGIIARQENLYNLYLDDDKFLVNAPRKTVTRAFPGRVSPASEGRSFILTLAGARKL